MSGLSLQTVSPLRHTRRQIIHQCEASHADAGFDNETFRHACSRLGIELNVPRNFWGDSQIDDDTYIDELMYEQWYVIEQNNTWQDSYRTLLIMQDTSLSSWFAPHSLFCIHTWIKQLVKL